MRKNIYNLQEKQMFKYRIYFVTTLTQCIHVDFNIQRPHFHIFYNIQKVINFM